MIFITGCGRSGTTRILKTLSLARFDCAFEPEVNNPTSNKELVVSWLSATRCTEDDTVYHIHRNPIDVAKSYRALAFFNNPDTDHCKCVTKHIGEDFLNSDIPELDFWIEWNRLIEPYADYTLHTNDFNWEIVVDIGRELSVDPIRSEDVDKTIESTTINHKSDTSGIIIPTDTYSRYNELQDMAGAYGYEV